MARADILMVLRVLSARGRRGFGDLLKTTWSVRLNVATQHAALASRYCR
jgi:hypothetical protein